MQALAAIERQAGAALWRMPAALSALVIVAGSLAAMFGLAAGMVSIIAIAVGR